MTRPICLRSPWGLRRLLRQHVGESGVVVYGWFNRQRGWTPAGSWAAVLVKLDGKVPAVMGRRKRKLVLDQLNRGPYWIPVNPGWHVVEFWDGRDIVRTERTEVSKGQAVVIAFRPPRRRGDRRAVWCVDRKAT